MDPIYFLALLLHIVGLVFEGDRVITIEALVALPQILDLKSGVLVVACYLKVFGSCAVHRLVIRLFRWNSLGSCLDKVGVFKLQSCGDWI